MLFGVTFRNGDNTGMRELMRVSSRDEEVVYHEGEVVNEGERKVFGSEV
jgi:hypothetical protein